MSHAGRMARKREPRQLQSARLASSAAVPPQGHTINPSSLPLALPTVERRDGIPVAPFPHDGRGMAVAEGPGMSNATGSTVKRPHCQGQGGRYRRKGFGGIAGDRGEAERDRREVGRIRKWGGRAEDGFVPRWSHPVRANATQASAPAMDAAPDVTPAMFCTDVRSRISPPSATALHSAKCPWHPRRLPAPSPENNGLYYCAPH